MELLMVALGSLVTSIPSVLVDITLLVVAMSRWNRHPRISMLACTSGVLMLVLDVLVRAVFAILPLKLRESGHSTTEMGVIYSVMGGVSGLAHAVAIGLLVAAVFSDRQPSPARELGGIHTQ
jgi:hypothetical protein